ncbi:MAG: hypothetical protein F6J95_000765 [Leptolyngbya sp. SIO1E4]|nr:hypothetical protein [Leptolyngbya sp. SIO1E4]
MSVETLRLLWSVVSETSPENVAGLSDEALIGSLLSRINSRLCLTLEDQTAVRSYLGSKRLLIREVIQG